MVSLGAWAQAAEQLAVPSVEQADQPLVVVPWAASLESLEVSVLVASPEEASVVPSVVLPLEADQPLVVDPSEVPHPVVVPSVVFRHQDDSSELSHHQSGD